MGLRKQFGVLLFLLFASQFFGCGINIFDPVDEPSTDEQYLSKARACFDDDDLDCALEYYKKVSNAYADTRNAEEAFAILHKNGAEMEEFVKAAGDGKSGGQMITKFANHMSDAGASQTKRLAIAGAYPKAAAIALPELRALVTLITSFAMYSEMLGELNVNSGNRGDLEKGDIATSPTSCKALTATSCAASATCDPIPSAGSAFTLNLSNPASQLSGSVTLEMLHAVLLTADQALSDLSASGKFSSGLSGVLDQLQGLTPSTNAATARCYVYVMITNGIGDD